MQLVNETFAEDPSTAIRREENAHVQDQQRCHPQQAPEQAKRTRTPHNSLHLGAIQGPSCAL
jgi:hypothetical protein